MRAAPVFIYAVLAILVIPVFPHYVSPNEFSRWGLAVAIVDFHTVEVTRLHFVWRPLAIVVPFALVIAAAFVAVPRRRIAIFLAGGAIWFFAGLPFAASAPRNVRAVVEAVHFQDGNAIERTAAGDARTRASLEAIARDKRRSPPDFWPF